MAPVGRSRFGNLTLSRLPVGQVFRHSLPRPPEEGVPSMPRVCLEVVVDTPAGALRVLNTHLEYYSRIQRMTQIVALHTLQCDAVRLASMGGQAGGTVRPTRRLRCGRARHRPWCAGISTASRAARSSTA
jgi:endonuclease/exonuclease/phosphatase family metal-dependent hydrolase